MTEGSLPKSPAANSRNSSKPEKTKSGGSYAYWVGDEGVKTKVNVVNPDKESDAQFTDEIDHLCQAIQEGTEIRTPGEMGLRDVRLIEAIYRSAELGRWVDVAPDGSLRDA